jgi:1-deoxy-D-xylulose-5-phosphate synthase
MECILDQHLKKKAEELRRQIIDVVSINGGHLGASLGAVDIILAMHTVFESPKDRFIFDTGHQTYAHKLLTGRKELFKTLRKYQGLCGFTNPLESEHDHFHAGHAGTALSLALGVQRGQTLEAQPFWTIALIGDASLSCGLTLEAFNNIQKKDRKLLIILNDNGMSISHGCGNFHEVLQNSSKKDHLLESFFSLFHLKYIGPFDGHDIELLVQTLESIKEMEGPVVLHIKTTKGYGLPFAEKSPVSWHAPKPFCIQTGNMGGQKSFASTFPKIFGKHLLELKKHHPQLHVVTPAMALGSCLEDFENHYPNDFDDVGIAEGHAVTYSGGLAKFCQKKVILSIYSTFLQRGFDNVFHDVVLQEIPVVFAIDRAGLSAQDGSTHHGIYDIGFLKMMPNLVIAQPRDGIILRKLLNAAFDYKAPCAIRYPNQETTDLSGCDSKIEVGKGELLRVATRGEHKILLIPLGHMVHTAYEVADLLEKEGFDASIFDPIFIKPIDINTLRTLIQSHDYIFVIEEHSKACGLGSIICQELFEILKHSKHFQIFGIEEQFVAHGSYKELMQLIELDPLTITKKILKVLCGNT